VSREIVRPVAEATARTRAIRLAARRVTTARALKVKISLGTPLRVYRESLDGRPLSRRTKYGPRFFRDQPRSETRRSKSRRGSRTSALLASLRDTALKVVAGSRDPRENRTVSHVPGGAIGNRFSPALSHLRSAQQRSLDGDITESLLSILEV